MKRNAMTGSLVELPPHLAIAFFGLVSHGGIGLAFSFHEIELVGRAVRHLVLVTSEKPRKFRDAPK